MLMKRPGVIMGVIAIILIIGFLLARMGPRRHASSGTPPVAVF